MKIVYINTTLLSPSLPLSFARQPAHTHTKQIFLSLAHSRVEVKPGQGLNALEQCVIAQRAHSKRGRIIFKYFVDLA